MNDKTIPPVPLALGVAGLIPFAGLAAMHVGGWGGPLGWTPDFVRTGLALYGAIILSFLGGIRWGLAVAGLEAANRNYLISVVPSLLGWFALALAAPWDLRTLGFLHVALGLLDYGLTCRTEAPEWFGTLRLGLAAGAGACLLAAGYF
jgi:hypothetical protein